jgi:predicted deacetylase
LAFRQIDDISPVIPCESEIIDKSKILMVIPLFENKSIAENKSWCLWILGLNKTLGMHGIYHTYDEFSIQRDKDYVNIGIKEFEKCLGFYPRVFEAPQLALSRDNEKILREMGFEVRGWPNMLARKVYHCQETGEFSMKLWKFKLTNKFIDWV